MRRHLWISLLLLSAAACVTPQPPAVQPPVAPPPVAGEAPVPKIPVTPAPDLSPLAGRTVALDPGHGGPWPGAVAPSNGLREGDVNLNVALEVQRLLQGAGANVVMTRSGDAVPKPGSASADLLARSEIGNASGAEVFVSIHHNADIAQGSARNDLEVYYKLGDSGPSLDLGQAMTHELAYRMRPEAPSKLLLPGNYKVLRESRLPASLLETSYMTHAGNATLMATDEGVRAEALAIAAGLARYFALDPPRPVSAELVTAPDELTQLVVAQFTRGLPLDEGSVEAFLDGKPAPGDARVQGHVLTWTFKDPLPNGPRQIEVRVRNAKGAATAFPVDAVVNRPVAQVAVTQRPGAFAGSPETEVLFEVRVTDTFGLPVADGTPVTLATTGAQAETGDGTARFYLAAGWARSPLVFVSGTVEAQTQLEEGPQAFRSLRVQDAQSNAPLGQAVVSETQTVLALTTAEGWAAIPAEVNEVLVFRKGYEIGSRPLGAPSETIMMQRKHGGVMFGKRIVLDPAYGGRNAGAVGPLATRGSDISLDVARRAAAALRDAGAEVLLTRIDDSDPSEMRRVEIAGEFGANIVVSVSYGSPQSASKILDAGGHQRAGGNAFVGHYPNSPNGTRLATALARALGIQTVTPSVSYVVQQTGAPAVLLQPATVADGDTENRMRDVKARQAVADAIVSAIVEYFGAER
ncbi:MAG: N-acetylmuramoyl-L-alanine amidase [FCB group bacterium]|jgi:N-acetylmuramoyl-L-alanine amidase|nr:N-acetylmuramoyl-L-alanine amidase [FCB group bacterium]